MTGESAAALDGRLMGRRDGLSARILVAALIVAGVALAIVGVGVLRIGAASFEALMMAAGSSADHAREMFDHSVTIVFGVAALVAAAVALVLAMALARRLARPLERIAAAAVRIADGDLEARVPEEGPAELRALAASYNEMAARLAQQEAVRREFIINASHELRTPLTNLQGYLEALRDGVLPPDPATFDSLREEVDRLTRLAASLDVLAGAEGTHGVAREVDVGAIVASSADLVAPALARRSITLRVEAPPGLVVRARPDELTQVLANLLQNAVRYTPDGGEVRRDGRGGRGRRCGSASPTPVRASRRPTCRASGSASTGSRSRATGSAAAPGSGSRSSASWSSRRAAGSASPARAAGRPSG